MYTFADIKQSLRRQDFDELTTVVPEFVSDESGSYEQILQQMLYLAGHEQLEEQPPLGVVYLDAVRDLWTLYEEPATDPWPVFRVALRYFCSLQLREFDKEVTTMQPEDMGQIVMVDDFVESLRTGDTATAVHEVVKLTWMMDNIFYLGEILTELAASAEEESGFPLVLAGAVLKSIDFVESAQLNPLLFLLTEYLSRIELGNPANRDAADLQGIHFERFVEGVFNTGQNDAMETVYLSYARQIWEAARMKEDSIRHAIYHHLASRYDFEKSVTSATEYSTMRGTIQDIIVALTDGDMATCHSLILGYIRDGTGLGTLFRHLTDIFLDHTAPDHPMDLILINGYRTAGAYLNPPAQYQAMLKAADLVREVMER